MNKDINIKDLGIVPINMQMIKKDVGLFNIFLNASLYKQYLSEFKIEANAIFDKDDLYNGLMNATDEEGKIKMIKLLSAESFLHKYLTRELVEFAVDYNHKRIDSEKVFVLPKHNQMRYELQIRLAIALYSIVKYMKKPDQQKDTGAYSTYQPVKFSDALSGLRD
jgi:hypothetical protein